MGYGIYTMRETSYPPRPKAEGDMSFSHGIYAIYPFRWTTEGVYGIIYP